MKKQAWVTALFCLLLTGMLCGCTDAEKTLTLELEENPSTGYTWSYTLEGDALKEVSNEYVAPKATLTGAPGKHTWTFEGNGDGEAVLMFLYSQPWTGGAKGDVKIYRYAVKKGVPTLVSEETIEAPLAEDILLRVDGVRTEGDTILVDVVYLQSEWVEPETEEDVGYDNITEIDGVLHTLTLQPDAYVDFSEDMGPDTVKVTPAAFAEKFAAGDYASGIYYTATVAAEEIQAMNFFYME